MECRVHRVIHNSNHWKRPSSGRLGKKGFGTYVEEHGFGHEDWNFNTTESVQGFVHGYTRAKPSEALLADPINIALATWDQADGWKLVGFYKNARYEPEGTDLPATLLAKRTRDLLALAKTQNLGSAFSELNQRQLRKALRKELQYYVWKVAAEDVLALKEPLKIPTEVFWSGSQRLIKQGKNPRGVFGIGEIAGPAIRGIAANGKVQWMCPIEFERLVDPAKQFLISGAALQTILTPNQLNAQASG